VALGFALDAEPVGKPHRGAALLWKEVLKLEEDVDGLLQPANDADAPLGGLLFQRRIGLCWRMRIALVCEAPTTSRQLRN
jgi:hypothetical protein